MVRVKLLNTGGAKSELIHFKINFLLRSSIIAKYNFVDIAVFMEDLSGEIDARIQAYFARNWIS